MNDIAIRLENLSKRYRLGQYVGYKTLRESLMNTMAAPFRRFHSAAPVLKSRHQDSEYIWALKDVSLEVKQGEVVGIIGRNGAGKTTLLKILSRITPPTEGYAEIRGRVGSLLEVGTGFHGELTGRENIYLNGAVLGMRKKEIDHRFDDIVEFAEVQKFIDTPLKRYSSGMQVRLAFSVAAHLEPEILLVDEVLAVGDYEFQKKCLGKMGEVGKGGRTVMVVSHQLNNIASLCPRTILLDQGGIVMSGDTTQVLEYYISTTRKKAGEVIWDDPQTAPGNEKVRLHAVRVLSPDGQATAELDIQQEIVLRVSYWNLQEGNSPKVSIIVRGQMDEIVFASVNLPSENSVQDPWFDSPFPVGLFETECRFPANLFNTITYSLDLHLTSNVRRRPLDIAERDIISFTVHDLQGRDSSGIHWRGGVRPKLAWRTEYLGPLEDV